MRNLASIQRVDILSPIKGADRIVKTIILGWECVVRKEEFNAGDLCVYFEIDSIVPDHPVFEFMRDRKFRIRTVKMRKQIAQGLALPIDILKEFKYKGKYKVGEDVTKIIGVVKYDPELIKENKLLNSKKHNFMYKYLMSLNWFRKLRAALGLKNKGNFPRFIRKTDEVRVQSSPRYLKPCLCYCTEKLDGASATFAYVHKHGFRNKLSQRFYVCSRNINLMHENNSHYWKIAKSLNLREKLKEIKESIAIQGEIIGPGIQGNKYKLKEYKLYIYNIWIINEQRYCNLSEKRYYLGLLDLHEVPYLGKIDLNGMTVPELIELSKGNSVFGDMKREGIVVRGIADDSYSFKVVNPDFLLDMRD